MNPSQLLAGEHENWCIMICTTREPSFGSHHEFSMFSNEIILPADSIRDLCLPSEYFDNHSEH
jgi:hypothetical protein